MMVLHIVEMVLLWLAVAVSGALFLAGVYVALRCADGRAWSHLAVTMAFVLFFAAVLVSCISLAAAL